MRTSRLFLFASAACLTAVLIIVCISVFLSSSDTGHDSNSVDPNSRIHDITANWYQAPGEDPIFTFDGNFPEMPDQMLVYRVIPPPNDVSEQYVRNLATKHFAYFENAKYSPGTYSAYLSTRLWRFKYDKGTGFFRVGKYPPEGRPESRDPNNFPSSEEAIRIATEYLRNADLLPTEKCRVSIQNTIATAGDISVIWTRPIGGYRTWGPANMLYVLFGPGGEVLDVVYRFFEIEPWKKVPIITPQQAFERLQNRDRAFLGSRGGQIDSVELRYHCHRDSRYIEPVYYFSIDTGGYAAVPATDPNYIAPPPDPNPSS